MLKVSYIDTMDHWTMEAVTNSRRNLAHTEDSPKLAHIDLIGANKII